MNSSLKDKLQDAGFKMSPKAIKEERIAKQKELAYWKFTTKERILNADNPLKEIELIIEEARNIFKGSSEQLLRLNPLYQLRDELRKNDMPRCELVLRVQEL